MLELYKKTFELSDLAEVMRILRSPEGCPWDREQTLATLKEFCLEEAIEVCDSIDMLLRDGSDARWDHLCEELGDLLLQVVFQAQLADEKGKFDLGDVVTGIVEKLVRRHPHVFGGTEARTSDDVLANWKVIKEAEKEAKEAGTVLTPGAAEALLSKRDNGPAE